MSFTPTSKNFDQNRNHIMKNQTNPTHVTQQHNTWNFIKNETLTEQKLKESNISSLNLIRNETLTEPQTSKLEKIILFIHIHTYIHTYIYRERVPGGSAKRSSLTRRPALLRAARRRSFLFPMDLLLVSEFRLWSEYRMRFQSHKVFVFVFWLWLRCFALRILVSFRCERKRVRERARGAWWRSGLGFSPVRYPLIRTGLGFQGPVWLF